jgi:hypothetical protein
VEAGPAARASTDGRPNAGRVYTSGYWPPFSFISFIFAASACWRAVHGGAILFMRA